MRRFAALWVVLAVLGLVEGVLRVLPMEFASGAGIFLTVNRRELAQSSLPEFDYIVLGDSRSLSLNGHAPTAKEPYSVYNFSLPALGPRYFRHYLQKILAHRKHKPAALIFAGDPRHFQKRFYRPHHDPLLAYSDSTGEGMADYLSKRLTRRVAYALAGGVPKANTELNDLVWDTFSHRYLHLFSFAELASQFTGAERVYILSEALPLVFATYRYRRGIAGYTTGFNLSLLREVPIPPYCGTCAAVMKNECFPTLPHPQDNRQMARLIRSNYGGINIGDRLRPELRIMTLMLRDRTVAEYRRLYDTESPDLRELELLIRAAQGLGLKTILVEVPGIDAYRGTRFYREYDRALAGLLARVPSARRFHFPEPFYPRELYIEHVHYSCEGAARLNRDFYSGVMPKILEFAPPAKDNRDRGFSGG